MLIADGSNHRIRQVSATGSIATVAGNGTAGFFGDGGQRASAQLNNPQGIAATADGGFLIGDQNNHRIRKVSATGTISTLAGDGGACSPSSNPCGDGGPAAAAQLNAPFGIAPMADGSFLIADETGHRIRKVEGSAATSPTNGKIVFSSGRDGNSEIYSMNADGSGQTRLTNNAAEDAEPSISADGQTVVFRSQRDGNAEIYAMSIDGTGVTRITNVAATDRDPSISADGQKVVFMSNRDGNFEIYSISIDGTGATRLTNSPNSDGSPEFSPDGQRVTFMRDTALVYEVYVMNANGTGVTQLTNNSVDDFHPTFSSDGQRIAFSSRRDGNHEIYVMDADGTDPCG